MNLRLRKNLEFTLSVLNDLFIYHVFMHWQPGPRTDKATMTKTQTINKIILDNGNNGENKNKIMTKRVTEG
jgi:hypothetical protein